MRVLVINCGSSSIKHRCYEMPAERQVGGGAVEGIGLAGGPKDHHAGIEAVCSELGDPPDVIAHRVVHGGDRFGAAAQVTPDLLTTIEELTPLAPLHNPANLQGVRVAAEAFPGVPQVVVFDTAFHQTIPRFASQYAIPREVAQRHGIKKYGFHGTSHRWASERAAALLVQPIGSLKTVVLHLGAGASACAVDGGRSVDTSMGFTPLAGLIMATRAGDLDPGVVTFLAREAGMTAAELDAMLNRESGLKGLAGDADLRNVIAAADQGDAAAQDALDAYTYRIATTVGGYAVAMGGLDALVFTGGVGERSAVVRAAVGARLSVLGVAIDDAANDAPSTENDRRIDAAGSQAAVCVIAANEELQIAREAAACVGGESADG